MAAESGPRQPDTKKQELSFEQLVLLLIAQDRMDLARAMMPNHSGYGSTADIKIQPEEGVLETAQTKGNGYLGGYLDFRVRVAEVLGAHALAETNDYLKRAAAAMGRDAMDGEKAPEAFQAKSYSGGLSRGPEVQFKPESTIAEDTIAMTKHNMFDLEVLEHHVREALRIRVQERPDLFQWMKYVAQDSSKMTPLAAASLARSRITLPEFVMRVKFGEKMSAAGLDEQMKAYPVLIKNRYDIIVDKKLATEPFAAALGIAPELIQRIDVKDTALLTIDRQVLDKALGIDTMQLGGGEETRRLPAR